MERLTAGHDAALNDLMERHATPVFHFLCRMVGNEDDANDLAQETFVRVFRARASFRTNEKFSTWLYTIAANLARNHFRWRSRHPNVSLEAETRRIGTNSRQHASGRRSRRRTNRPWPPNAPPPCAPPSADCLKICAKRLCCANGRNVQRGRSRGDSGNHTEGRRIAACIAPGRFCANG